jgi:hypothetical protein
MKRQLPTFLPFARSDLRLPKSVRSAILASNRRHLANVGLRTIRTRQELPNAQYAGEFVLADPSPITDRKSGAPAWAAPDAANRHLCRALVHAPG